jgi:hypothetical protein
MLHKVFYVPIFTFRFEKHDTYDFSDIAKQGKIDSRPKGWTTPVNSSFPNISDNDRLISPDVRDSLIKDLSEQMKRLFISNGIPDKFVVHNFWYNVYHDYQGQEPHTHLTGCMEQTPYWCGIYYNKGATPTTFFRPDSNNRVHQFPYKSENFREYFADSLQPNLHDGDVILFPPYLMHCVDLQTSANMRLTFSFNLLLHNEQRVPLG